MGIKNLTQLINKYSPDSINHVNLHDFDGKTLAIDASILIYKCLINVRHNNDYLKNLEGKIISHIHGIYFKTINYISMGIKPVYIFDGKPPQEKDDCLKQRYDKVSEMKNKINDTNDKDLKLKLEKSTVRIKKEYIDDLIKLFNYMGVSYIKAPGEAESYAAELCRMNYVDGVISEDMDTLVYSCPLLIRNCIDKSIKRNNIVTTFNYDKIIKDFKMNKDEFIDLCILCGCDYSPSIPKVGSITSFKIIKQYKSIDEYIKSDNNLATEEFKNKYLLARQIFNQYYNNIIIDDIPIVNSEYNSEKLYNYLVNECSINKNKIINSFKKII